MGRGRGAAKRSKVESKSVRRSPRFGAEEERSKVVDEKQVLYSDSGDVDVVVTAKGAKRMKPDAAQMSQGSSSRGGQDGEKGQRTKEGSGDDSSSVAEECDDEKLPDPVDPFAIFPEEVWLIIFDKLENQDVHNVHNTCRSWNELLRNKRTTFLLSGVCQPLMKYLPKNDFIQCRQMSRSSRKSVDHAYANHPAHLTFNKTDFYQAVEETSWFEVGHYFCDHDQVQRFLEDMKDHRGNPFPGRCVELYSEDGDERMEQQFWESVKVMLQRFGKEIWYLYLTLEVEEEYQTRLRDCLSFVPNLRKLKFVGPYVDNEWNWMPRFRHAEHETRAHFRRNPLPELPCLETVAVDSVQDGLAAAILNTCSAEGLKRLLVPKLGISFHARRFKNLEVLAFELQSAKKDIAKFPKSLTWPLKVLRLEHQEFIFNGGATEIPYRMFARFVEQFGNTLEEIGTDIKISVEKEDLVKRKLNLPKLKRLRLELDGSMDVFLPLKALEELRIPNYVSRNQRGSIVKVFGFEYRMYNSNIWELMPRLQTLEFSGQSRKGYEFNELYERRHYEYYQEH